MTDQAPLSKTLTADADTVAKGADGTIAIGAAPFAGKVTAVTYVPSAAISGTNTNTRTISLVNKGQAGAGSTVVASLALVSGTNATAFDETALTLSGTAANLEVAQGDVLAFASVHTAEGLVDPGGEVRVTIARS